MKRLFFIPLLLVLVAASSLQADSEIKEDYRIRAGDVLQIAVLGEEDMNRECRVSAMGKISYPLLGEVSVVGKSSQQTEVHLTEFLNEYLVDPQVTIFITQFSKVFITGQVSKPNAFEYRKALTVLEAITLAGGLTPTANARKIRIIRKGGDDEKTIIVDLTEIMVKGKYEKDIYLMPGDIVFVPESFL